MTARVIVARADPVSIIEVSITSLMQNFSNLFYNFNMHSYYLVIIYYAHSNIQKYILYIF